jgi:DNA-directed RNA polymerase specialized sigma24 family protein
VIEDRTPEDSVTIWLDGIRAGDDGAVERLWDRYFSQLVRVATFKLPPSVKRDFDEEDVALSAFYSLCTGLQKGKIPPFEDRDNLWPLLVVITARKAMYRTRAATAQKRGGGRIQGESIFASSGSMSSDGMNQIVGDGPTPAFAAEVSEEFERLMNLLPDDAMRRLAAAKMEGYTNQELANMFGYSLRTVERRLNLIRQLWEASD